MVMVARKDALGIESGFTTVRPDIGMKERYERWRGAAVVRHFCGCSEIFGPPPEVVVIRGLRGPSPLELSDATSLTATGDWTFGANVSVVGDVTLGAEGGHVEDGTVIR